MPKYKVFISSVQSEFANERQLVYDFICNDELMGQYFDPFIFERIPAQNANPSQLYLEEASSCQVYLLLVGQCYGNALPGEFSPTEKEYLAAGKGNAYRVAFIKDLDGLQRDEREEHFFLKVQKELSYRVFSNPSVLVSLVKQSLYAFLKYKGIIQTLTFDEQIREDASMADIDARKIKDFLHQARQKTCFSSEGGVAEQISQATSWVMSKLSVRFGQRNEEAQNKVEFEIPRSVIFETIVNSVAHRDYNSTGSVQVSVFRNRIVVRNPGTLPVELTKADLMKEHGSYPHNPYLAEVMYQMGYIEKYGTGITENIRRMQEAHLLAPEIDLSAEFITTIWRNNDATNLETSDNYISTSAPNIATSALNIATSSANIATDYLAENKRIIDGIVKPKVKLRMTKEQMQDCIIEACIVDHSLEELAALLHKTPQYLKNFIIPELVADGILLRTKPSHNPKQTYMTNPKYKKV